MLYRIIGEEIATRRHVEIPNWDAPDIGTAKRLATQIGVRVSRIEPMNAAAEIRRDTARDIVNSCVQEVFQAATLGTQIPSMKIVPRRTSMSTWAPFKSLHLFDADCISL